MSYTKEQSLVEFDSWSSKYDASLLQKLLFVPSHNSLLAELRELDRPAARVLDIGCGTGVFAERLSQTDPSLEVWAVDFSRKMIDEGRRRMGGRAPIHFVQADSESLPLADGMFDAITCSNSFHHYPNQARAVIEMHRVLRPGGKLMIIDGYRDRLWGRFIYDVCVVAVEGAVQHASARRFRELFHDAGFTRVRQQARLGLAPFLLTVGTAVKSARSAGTSLPPAAAA
jgi:ubiquinone/menaquinone biosynthesis C-methylase UbiE